MKHGKNLLTATLLLLCLLTLFPATGLAATLKSGSTGTEVKKLQMNLNGLAYRVTADGIYGAATTKAVRNFQSANGLSADGIAGTNTLSKLTATVKQLQNNLKNLGYNPGTADGVYGTSTTKAVKKFQSDYGLTADGIAGAKTRTAISGAQSAGTATSYARTASNVVTYSLSQHGNTKLTNNFTVAEFRCKDGSNTVKIDTKLAALLQEIRNYFGKPVKIVSGYRTASYNKQVGGASSSLHVSGKAADISIAGVTPLQIARYAQSLGVKGIGLYSSFVHVDTRTTKYYWNSTGSSTYAVSAF